MERIPQERQEQEEEPSILLRFFRHDEKEKNPPAGQEQEGDAAVRLTPAGRTHAAEVERGQGINPAVALAYGSPRVRSLETAYQRLMADVDPTLDKASLEEMRSMMKSSLQGPKKEIVASELDFVWGGEFERIAMEHYKKTQDALVFLFEDSDKLVADLHDTTSRSYSRTAAEIGKLVKKYVKMLPVWQRITSKEPGKYADLGNEIQRLLGSHQTVTECFLLKVVEVSQGREAARKLLDTFKSKNGFDFSEGFDVRVRPSAAGAKGVDIVIKFKSEEWHLNEDQLDQIVAGGALEQTASEEAA